MRTLSLATVTLTAAALLGACGAEAGPTAVNAPDFSSHQRFPQHTSSTIAIDDEFINPCNGETVHVTGTIDEQVTIVPSELVGGLHFELQDVFSASGVGTTSGASYRAHGTTQTSFDSPNFEALNATFSDRARLDFIADSPGLSFRLIVDLHLVDLPSGEEKVTRDVESLECLG